jgi:hypothetical protein
MKATIKLLEKQHRALVEVIQFLDSHRHSDEPVRDTVDTLLNHSEDLTRKSDEEIKQAREVLKRYEYDDEY